MPNIRDLLPPPPWKGPPLPRMLTDYPKYGPSKTSPPELKQFWAKVLHDTEKQYPLNHPSTIAEAKHAGVTPREIQLMIAHERWLEEKQRLYEKWYKEYQREEQEEEEE